MKAYEPIDSDAVRLRNKFTFVSPSLCHNLNEMLSKISDCNCLKKQSIDSCCEDVFSFNVDLLVWVSNRFDTFRCRFFSYFGHLNKVRKVNIGFIMFTEWTVFVWTSLWELDALRVKRENGKKPARNRRSTTIYSDRAMCVCVYLHSASNPLVRHPLRALAKINLLFICFLVVSHSLFHYADKCASILCAFSSYFGFKEGNFSIARKMFAFRSYTCRQSMKRFSSLRTFVDFPILN